MKAVYLFFCILGTLLPLSQFVPFVFEHGPNVSVYFEQLFATRISTFFGLDVIVSALVVIVFAIAERRSIRFWYVPILATLIVGVSLGLPLLLLLRETSTGDLP